MSGAHSFSYVLRWSGVFPALMLYIMINLGLEG